MGFLAPFVCFLIIRHLANRAGFRKSLIIACVIWGTVAVAMTELLSLVHALSFWGLLISWLAVDLGLLIAVWRSSRAIQSTAIQNPKSAVSTNTRVLAAGTASLAAALFVIGLISAPSNWDSMTYHLARVMHWMQQGSVSHYPAGYVAQLYQPPWAEFVLLHLQLLVGSDRLSFAVQWFSMVICILGSTWVAEHFAAGARGQVATAVFIATLPSGIMQANSTQNSYVLAAWLVCAVVSLLCLADAAQADTGSSRPSPNVVGWALFFGAAIGMATLTKGTAYFFAFPLLIWFAVLVVVKLRSRRVLSILLAACMAATINAGHWSRNWNSFRSPIIPQTEGAWFRPQGMNAQLLALSMVRNISLHIATPSSRINEALSHAVTSLHNFLGVATDDPRFTFPGPNSARLHFKIDEDLSGNPLHLSLIAAAFVVATIALFRKKSRARAQSIALMLTICGGFILFCANIKCERFDVRLHLPLFILAGPLIGVFLGSIKRFELVCGILLAASMPYIIVNPSRPLVGRHSIFKLSREQQYFENRMAFYEPYRSAAQMLVSSGSYHVGVQGTEVWEYPLWVMIHDRSGRWPTIDDYATQGNVAVQSPRAAKEFQAILIFDDASGEATIASEIWKSHQLGSRITLAIAKSVRHRPND